jgi:hypothetical protein
VLSTGSFNLSHWTYTVKKRLATFPSPAGGHSPNSPWAGIIKLLPPRESLVSDIQAGNGNVASLFLPCSYTHFLPSFCFFGSSSRPQTHVIRDGTPHKVHIYLEYHSVCPLVGIGTPPLSRMQVCFPPEPKGEGFTLLPPCEGVGEYQFLWTTTGERS